MHSSEHFFLPVAPGLRDFREPALERLRYLYPGHSFEIIDGGIRVSGAMHTEVLRDVHYTLHRAKIAVQAAPLREMLYRSALQP